METCLEELLERNYRKINPDDVPAIIRFISETSSVLDRDIIFVKRLTKVAAKHILDLYPDSLDGLLERVFRFHEEGINLIEAELNRSETDSEDTFYIFNLREMMSHIYGHAGDVARTLFTKTDDMAWAEKWYYMAEKSATLSSDLAIEAAKKAGDLDKEHQEGFRWFKFSYKIGGYTSHAFRILADAACEVFSKTKSVEWANKSYDPYLKSAEIQTSAIGSESELKVCARSASDLYLRAGEIAETAFNISGEVQFAEKWHKACKKATEPMRDKELKWGVEDRETFANRYLYASKAARAIFYKTGNLSWAREWYRLARISAALFEYADYKIYASAGDAAYEIFKKTRDISWAGRWHSSYGLSADQIWQDSDKLSAEDINSLKEDNQYGFIGNVHLTAGYAARVLFRKTRNPEWAQTAIGHYEDFARLPSSGLNPKKGLISIANSWIYLLRKRID